MSLPLHPLLSSQLRRVGIEGPLPSPWAELLQRVSKAYVEAEQDRRLLERSQEIASNEMTALYAAVQAERDSLELKVRERTEALRLSEARLQSLVSMSSDWIWECDAQGRITYCSESLAEYFGKTPPQAIGAIPALDPALNSPSTIDALHAMVAARAPFHEFTFALMHHDGGQRWVRISGMPVRGTSGEYLGYRGVGADVTRDKQAEHQMQQLARLDSLTGLANRNRLLEELERVLERAQRQPVRLALLFIDLDRFKAVNDTLGHAAGDELLTTVAARLRDRLRGADLLARFGGDEFVVLAEGRCTPASVAHVAGKLLAAVAAPVCIQGREFEVSCSIGVSIYPDDGRDADTLLKHADAAMYHAKSRGKNGFHCFTADLSGQAAYQFTLEADLRQAIKRDELVLHYQPRYRMSGDRQLCGMEALLRWQHPQRGLLGPNEFIPVAEESGLILPIGQWVIEETCRQMRLWRDEGVRPPTCAVNLSARQLAQGGLVEGVAGALSGSDLPGRDLEVEVTESVLMADPEMATTILQRLHELGVQVAIDDFGTGHSALSYLKRFPAGTIKIDRSFVRGLPADRDDAAITQAVVAMSHKLGLRVVAEGIETPEQLQYLIGIGCDEAQGYLLGRPVSAEATGALLRAALPGRH